MRSNVEKLSLDQRFAALDDAKAAFVSKVYTTLGFCLILSTAGCAYTVANYESMLNFALMSRWITLGMIFFCMFVPLRGPIGWVFLLSFVTLMGISIGPLIKYYTDTDSGTHTVGMALGLTAAIFAGLTLYVRITGKNFSYMGGFLCVGTIALLITGIGLMFFPSANVYYWWSCIGALLFCGWILYDTSAVTREFYQANDVVGAVLHLFIDIFNLFLFLLTILGGRRD